MGRLSQTITALPPEIAAPPPEATRQTGWRRRFRLPLVKRILPRTLFGRSLLIVITPIVLLQLIATYVFYDRHWDKVAGRMGKTLGGEIGMVIEALEKLPDDAARAILLDVASRRLNLELTLLPDAILPRSRTGLSILNPFGPMDENLGRSIRRRVTEPLYVDSGSLPGRVRILVQTRDGVLRVVTTNTRVFSASTYVFILTMMGSSVVLMAIAIAFLRKQMRPIDRLAEAADSLGKGREVTDFRPTGAVEIRKAARAFLRMRERIRRQITQRTEMLAGVSHDLRTPLTRMKLQLAMLGDTAAVANLRSDVDEMERMVEGYLAFARGQDSESPVDTDLRELLEEVVSDAARQGRSIGLTAKGKLELPLRPDAFKRCITNLVENAHRYGDTVEISARRGRGVIEITVDDDGPGIPEAEREAAFRAFHRLDESRNRETGGSGLGLTIALDVARSHGGGIQLTESPLGGLRALVRLPV